MGSMRVATPGLVCPDRCNEALGATEALARQQPAIARNGPQKTRGGGGGTPDASARSIIDLISIFRGSSLRIPFAMWLKTLRFQLAAAGLSNLGAGR
jgi:hypothetical protein